jgi:Spy/CpxP family protein refolding chaperone
MKKFQISLLALLFCFFGLSSFAQIQQPGAPQPQGPPPPTLETLKQQLQLSTDQEAKIKVIMDKYRPQLQQARKNNTDPSVRRAGVAGAMDAQREEIRGVLTQDQNDKLDAISAQRGERRVGGEMEREIENKDNPMRKEIRGYIAQNIMPVLRQQRQKLNAVISPEDQATLANLSGDMKEKGKEMRNARDKDGPKSDELKGLKQEKGQVKAALSQLATKYSADINKVIAEINPQTAKWKQDIQAISAKYPASASGGGDKKMGDGSNVIQSLVSPKAILMLNPNKK